MNRNHFLMLGLVVLMLGIQLQIVDGYVLTEKATQVAAKATGKEPGPVAQSATLFMPASGPSPITQKTVTPPDWLGWMLMSIGSVLVLHSFAMPRPTA